MTGDHPSGRIRDWYTRRDGETVWVVIWDEGFRHLPSSWPSAERFAEGQAVLLIDGELITRRNGRSS